MPSNSRTVSAVAAGIIGLSLTGSLETLPGNQIIGARYNNSAIYQTTSSSSPYKYPDAFSFKSPMEEALELFGEQSYFTEEEEKFFWDTIDANSKDTGVNYFELF